jgi:hypothetical protein
VKAKHFVMALHDHVTAKASQMLTVTTTSSPDAPPETVNNTISPPDIPANDSWALEYINVDRIQPLMEAIDGDGSSFITVNELNKFTSRRPKEWR